MSKKKSLGVAPKKAPRVPTSPRAGTRARAAGRTSSPGNAEEPQRLAASISWEDRAISICVQNGPEGEGYGIMFKRSVPTGTEMKPYHHVSKDGTSILQFSITKEAMRNLQRLTHYAVFDPNPFPYPTTTYTYPALGARSKPTKEAVPASRGTGAKRSAKGVGRSKAKATPKKKK